MPNSITTATRVSLLAFLLIAQVGCAAKSLLNWNRISVPEADERNPVRKIICVWEPVQGQGLDGLPSRGFAGQIMFFTNGSPSPATSEGDVRVYLFHNRGTPEEQAKPIHQFDFKGEAWAQHLTKSVPGPSYRIFIPYVDKQPWQVNCGVRVRLTPPNGSPVFSEMVHVRLPGPSKEEPDAGVIGQPQTEPELLHDSNDAAETTLGAVLERHRGIAPGAAEPSSAAKQLTPIERARQILADEIRKKTPQVNEETGSREIAVNSGGASVGDNDTVPEPAKAVSSSKQQPSRQLVRGNTPNEPIKSRRFRLAPIDSNKAHPLNDSDNPPDGAETKQPHPLDDIAEQLHPLAE